MSVRYVSSGHCSGIHSEHCARIMACWFGRYGPHGVILPEDFKSTEIQADDDGDVYDAEDQGRAGFEVANLLHHQAKLSVMIVCFTKVKCVEFRPSGTTHEWNHITSTATDVGSELCVSLNLYVSILQGEGYELAWRSHQSGRLVPVAKVQQWHIVGSSWTWANMYRQCDGDHETWYLHQRQLLRDREWFLYFAFATHLLEKQLVLISLSHFADVTTDTDHLEYACVYFKKSLATATHQFRIEDALLRKGWNQRTAEWSLTHRPTVMQIAGNFYCPCTRTASIFKPHWHITGFMDNYYPLISRAQSSLEDYRPSFVFGSLESRITKDAQAKLKQARDAALKDFETAKCFLSQLKQSC